MIIVAVLCLSPRAFAQDDVEGAEGHPLISRVPGFYIAEYMEKDSDSVHFESEKAPRQLRSSSLSLPITSFDVAYHLERQRFIPLNGAAVLSRRGNERGFVDHLALPCDH